MEATASGPNRTGAARSPKDIDLMLEAVRDLSPPMPINTLHMDMERQTYITEAESLGSVPPQKILKKALIKLATPSESPSMSILLDKLGERIAFERTGTRLYTALISKHLAHINSGQDDLASVMEGEAPADTLRRIRSEELGHFHLLCESATALGADPTAQTPCADVTATASMGLMQVVTDPRTTLAQCLNAVLTAELTDNAGWELLIQLAEGAGLTDMTEPFTLALEAEQQHVEIVRGWLQELLIDHSGTPAV